MEEKKKSSVGFIIVLILIILGLSGYIAYDKFFMVKEETNVKEEEKAKKLDINSRLVQSLHNKFKTKGYDDVGFACSWIYGLGADLLSLSSSEKDVPDFYADKGSEKIKMALVLQNMNSNDSHNYSCSVDPEVSKVPDNISIEGELAPRQSECAIAKQVNGDASGDFNIFYYNRKDVEKVYKELFGSSKKLNTSVPIIKDPSSLTVYYYVEDLDQYVAYSLEGGFSSFPGQLNCKEEVTKAIIKGKELKIYATFTSILFEEDEQGMISENSHKTETATKVVYTFKLDSDGMYTFVSRTKDK